MYTADKVAFVRVDRLTRRGSCARGGLRALPPLIHIGPRGRDVRLELGRCTSRANRRGGELFRTLLEAGLVDTVEPAIVPVLLGEGIPMLPATGVRTRLRLAGKRVYPKSGIVLLEYAVEAGQLA